MDSTRLADADAYLYEKYPTLNSLLIARHGYLVMERSARGKDALNNIKSATKSVTSILTGIALDTHDLGGLDDPLSDFYPEYFTSGTDPRKRTLSIRDLLAMRSGIEWSEWGSCAIEMTASPHWIRFVLDEPLTAEPGERFNYSTGDTQLLAGILQKASGITLLDFADLYLFRPLGITQRTWPTDPQGINIGGAELSLTAGDMLKIGYLVLNRGRWDDTRVVSADWIDTSTRQHSLVIPPDASSRPAVGYGYLWWLRPHGSYMSAMAVGYGGQYIYVIPALDLVIVITGMLRDVPRLFADNRMIREFNFVQDWILPAITDRP